MGGELLLSLAVATSTITLESWVDAVVRGRGELPSLAAVQQAAVEALEVVSRSEADSWAGRARWRGVVPRIDARFGTDMDFDLRDSLTGRISSVRTEGRGFGFDLRARFELGRLVFDDGELAANHERLARSAAIRLARDRVTKIYFERLKVLYQLRLEPSSELVFEAARLDGALHALTGGRLEDKRR